MFIFIENNVDITCSIDEIGSVTWISFQNGLLQRIEDLHELYLNLRDWYTDTSIEN